MMDLNGKSQRHSGTIAAALFTGTLAGFVIIADPACAALGPSPGPTREAFVPVGWDARLDLNFDPNYATGGMNRRFEGGFDQRFDAGGSDNR